jgi:phage tail-like protein
MSDGNGHPTFTGPGFGTLQQLGVPGASLPAPRVVSQRATLRRAMPSIYHDPDGDPSAHLDPTGNRDPFVIRFLGALERVLDPIGGVLDTLPEHFSTDYATRPMLDMLAAWIGVDIDVHEVHERPENGREAPDEGRAAERVEAALEARRKAVRMAAELAKARGTTDGLMLALELTFPDLRFRIEDGGSVRWPGDGVLAEVDPPRFVVYVQDQVSLDRQIAIAQCIDRHKPVQATYRLKVKKASD